MSTFSKKGGGSTPKFTFLKSVYTLKRGFKRDLLKKECVLLSSESIRRSLGTQTFFLKFLSTSFYFKGEGVNANLEKSIHLKTNIFLRTCQLFRGLFNFFLSLTFILNS